MRRAVPGVDDPGLEQLALAVDGEDASTATRPGGADTSEPRGPARDIALVDHAVPRRASHAADGGPAHGHTGSPPPDAGGAVEPPLVLTVAQLESALQLGRTRTYELIRSREIPVLRVGRLIRVSRAALEQWIAERSLPAANDSSRRFTDLP